MTNNFQSPTRDKQAMNSVHSAHDAVVQAQSHPDENMIGQAERAIRHADAAVAQAMDGENTQGAELAAERLEEDRRALEEL
ncbi:hypothetical protein MJA45_21325 [Paenibacillus aurantius]|uniref:Uncharacterized protein n=1 Tax=Paenibacillus aurantius TaxID=2918900 RepID=A0AA96LBL1_9BACL|nr:hypothetical protein [Paenibacillus aurantius]WJH34907.1 hypothetical protein N6H14_01705 [Paenibacillus sp. CC-CFT747]WNQ10143.1 hypothetical protein MJA45_21325 [Paenibacillus aurantius]